MISLILEIIKVNEDNLYIEEDLIKQDTIVLL